MTDKIVVHTPTEEDWNEVQNYALNVLGLEWGSSDGFLPFSDHTYGAETVINISDSCLYYTHYKWYEAQGDFEIISMEEFRKRYYKEEVTTVGDITSTAKGSGARYNNGKPDYSLLVIRDIVPVLSINTGLSPHYDLIVDVIVKLGVFQQTHDSLYLNHILELLGQEAVEESTYVFTYGASKYAAWNWAKGAKWSVPLACAVRHCLKILNGEEVDHESGRKHTGHIVCNIFMLIHYCKYYKEGNDLPEKWMFGN